MTLCLKQQSCDLSLPFESAQESLHLGSLAKARECSNSLDDAVKGLLSLSDDECSKKRPFASMSTDQDFHDSSKKRRKSVRFDPSTVFHQGKKKHEHALSQSMPVENQVCLQPLHNLFIRMARQCPLKLFEYCSSKGFLRKTSLPNGQTVFIVVAPTLPSNCPLTTTPPPSATFGQQNPLAKSPSVSGNFSISNSTSFSSNVDTNPSIPSNAPNNEIKKLLSNSQSKDSVDIEDPSSQSLSTDFKERDSSFQESAISPKLSNPSIYLCREFLSLRLNETTTFNHPPVAVDERYSLGLRPMMTEKEIMKIAREFFGDIQANKWDEELNLATAHSLVARNAYLTRYGHHVKNPRVKIIFQLLQCSDFFYSPRGQRVAQDQSLPCFVQDFENSLLRVLVSRGEENSCERAMDLDMESMQPLSMLHDRDVENLNLFSNKKIHKQNRSKEGSVRFRNQQALLSTLPLVYFCVSHLIADHGMQLEYNLCQFLLLASCLEGRGVYHYRASNNLSTAHKAYRYMIERIGGKEFSAKNFESCDRAEKELIRTFERA